MFIALRTGTVLVDLVAEPLGGGDGRDLARALREFARAKRVRFGQKRLLSLALQGVIRRPWLCEAIGRALSRSPERTRAFLGAIGNQYTPLEAAVRIALARSPRTPAPPAALGLGARGGSE
jgi:hypothetical protein